MRIFKYITPGKEALALALLLCLLAPESYAINPNTQRVITIEADEWCPINCRPSESKAGIGIDLAKKIFEPLGYRIDYRIVPWTQALADVRAGKADAVIGASKHDDPTLVFPDNAIYNMSDDFYIIAGNSWRYQGMHTLKGRPLGIIKDYGYGDAILKYIEQNKNNHNLVIAATGEAALQENINRLRDGQINILVESRPVMEYTLRKLHLEDKIVWAGGMPQNPVYLAFSPAKPGSKALAEQYDAAIRRMREAGALGPMYGAYGLRP